MIYASNDGTVENIVRRLLMKSKEEILSINVLKEEVPNLDDYDNVMIGGSIYHGKIQKQLTKFIHGHLQILLTKRVGLFLYAGETEKEKVAAAFDQAFPEVLRNHSVCNEIFGYSYQLHDMNLFEKMFLKRAKGATDHDTWLNETGIEHFFKTMLI